MWHLPGNASAALTYIIISKRVTQPVGLDSWASRGRGHVSLLFSRRSETRLLPAGLPEAPCWSNKNHRTSRCIQREVICLQLFYDAATGQAGVHLADSRGFMPPDTCGELKYF